MYPSPGGGHRGHVERGEGRGKRRGGGGEPQASSGGALPSCPRTQGGRGVGCRPHLPISRTIKTTFKFFSPGLISFIKRGGSLTPFILRQVRLQLRRRGWAGSGTKPPTLPGKGEGAGETLGGGGEENGQKAVSQGSRKPAQTALSPKKEEGKKKKAHKFKRKKRRTSPHKTPLPMGRQ